MKSIASLIVALSVASALAATAFASDRATPTPPPTPAAPAPTAAPAPAAPPAMDMSKMGPWTRKPTNAAKTKQEIVQFFKDEETMAKKGDFNASLDRVDFPVYMVTDDAAGKTESKQYSREEYTAMMKPFYENAPKDMNTAHKPTVTVLSDSLVSFTDAFTMTMGKQKMVGVNSGLLVKVGGVWKWKVMVEAGWGGMGPK